MPENMRNATSGYTLIELVLVIILVAVLTIVGIQPILSISQGWVATSERKDLNDETRSALDRMLRETRNIRRKADNTPVLTTADAASISFTDVDARNVSFSWGGADTALLRNADAMVPGGEVTAFLITYYDQNNTMLSPLPLAAAGRDQVRRVMVEMSVAKGAQDMTVTGQAYFRSLSGY